MTSGKSNITGDACVVHCNGEIAGVFTDPELAESMRESHSKGGKEWVVTETPAFKSSTELTDAKRANLISECTVAGCTKEETDALIVFSKKSANVGEVDTDAARRMMLLNGIASAKVDIVRAAFGQIEMTEGRLRMLENVVRHCRGAIRSARYGKGDAAWSQHCVHKSVSQACGRLTWYGPGGHDVCIAGDGLSLDIAIAILKSVGWVIEPNGTRATRKPSGLGDLGCATTLAIVKSASQLQALSAHGIWIINPSDEMRDAAKSSVLPGGFVQETNGLQETVLVSFPNHDGTHELREHVPAPTWAR